MRLIKYGLVPTVKNRRDEIVQLVEIIPSSCYGEGKFYEPFLTLFRSGMKTTSIFKTYKTKSSFDWNKKGEWNDFTSLHSTLLLE